MHFLNRCLLLVACFAGLALEASPSDDVTVRVLDGLNHLFQPAETGLPSRYAQIETTMAPRALRTVHEWIQERSSVGQ